MAPMINMLSLLNDLQQNEWHITAFQFTYKNTHYIVLFEDISNLPLVNGEYIAFLTFIDKSNENRIFQTKANEFKFSAKAKEFREYFNIECANNLGDIFKQFYSYFGGFIPTLRVKNFDNQTQQAIINQLSRNDHENVNNLCCYAAKRNGKHDGVQYHRTPFNSDKTKLLRSALFDKLGKNDNTISFYYREENPLDDIEIYTRFAQQYGIK